ncbi:MULTISPECIES: N-acetylmuramic acid 6-phosphate etherase [unclassified Erythrobacter]|nr:MULTISPECIES: N-acetylmuramic acid 6-phosphate etherase [unclassified Erythrobacter]
MPANRPPTRLSTIIVDADVEEMLLGHVAAAHAAAKLAPQIKDAVSAAVLRLRRGGRIILVGAGTSGRIAVQDGVELAPTYGWPMDRLAFLLAGGLKALVESSEAAEDDAALAVQEISDRAITTDDVVIGVAASGRTPYTCAAIEHARSKGGLTIGIANQVCTPLLELAEIALCAETGAEFISGSTRMKAGTAQKIVLNTLSTGIMIGLGRTHNGLMTHMSVSNDKLRRRAVDIISSIAGTSPENSEGALEEAENDLPVAILIAAGHDREEAKRLLGEADYSVAKALSLSSRPSEVRSNGA